MQTLLPIYSDSTFAFVMLISLAKTYRTRFLFVCLFCYWLIFVSFILNKTISLLHKAVKNFHIFSLTKQNKRHKTKTNKSYIYIYIYIWEKTKKTKTLLKHAYLWSSDKKFKITVNQLYSGPLPGLIFFGVQNPEMWTFWIPKVNFLNLIPPPLNLWQEPHFLIHFLAKSGSFGIFGILP